MRKGRIIISALMAAILACGAGLAIWKRSELRSLLLQQRASALLTSARSSFAKGQYVLAENQALVAHHIFPGQIDSLRMAAAAALEGKDPGAANLALALQMHVQASLEDKALALRICRLTGEDSLLPIVYSRLTAVERKHVLVAVEMSRYCADRGNSEAARQFLDPFRSQSGQSPELGAALVHSLIHSPDHLRRGEAGRLIASLVTDFPTHPSIRQMMEELAFLPSPLLLSLGLPEEPDVLLQAFGESPIEVAVLAAESFRLIRQPRLDSSRLDELSRRCGASPALCRWLNVHQGSEQVLILVSESAAMSGPLAVYQERLQALFNLGRLEEAERVLQERHPSLDAIRQSCLLAKLYQDQNRAGLASQAWDKAIHLATADKGSNRFLEIAMLARKTGAREVAQRAMFYAVRHPEGRLPRSGELLWLIESLGQAKNHDELFQLTRRLLSQEREHPVLLNNALYLLALKTGKAPERSADVMAAVVEEYPAVPAFRTTLALLRALQGDAEPALRTFQEVEWETLQTNDTDRLIYATVLRLNGKEEDAKAVEARIQLDSISQDEQRFFRRLHGDSGG